MTLKNTQKQSKEFICREINIFTESNWKILTNMGARCKILPGGRYKFMLYKIRKMSEGITIKARYESGENIDRLELARFSNANMRGFISDGEIKGKWVVAQTTWDRTLLEYLENSLNFQAIVLLLRQCIDLVEDIVKNNFLLMYVEFDMERVWVSNFGALQFLYLPAEETRDSRRVMSFMKEIVERVNTSDDVTEMAFSEIKEKVESMPCYSSVNLREIIDSAEKNYLKMMELKDESNEESKEEEPVGTSSNFSAIFPQLYNLDTGEIMTYNPGDVIVLSDRDLLNQDITSHFRRNFKPH